MFYQMTWDEYIAGDIEYTPKVEKADGGRRFFLCPLCGACVGGVTAQGDVWSATRQGRCKNGHRIGKI